MLLKADGEHLRTVSIVLYRPKEYTNPIFRGGESFGTTTTAAVGDKSRVEFRQIGLKGALEGETGGTGGGSNGGGGIQL